MGKKRTIGRTDIVDFPALGLHDIPVKIDTGAFTSSIHCSRVQEEVLDGRQVLVFCLLDEEDPYFTGEKIIAEKFERTQVKSSSGHMENRYVIETDIELFDEEFSIELSLTDRTEMKFPVLLGRKMLSNRFIVDVNRTDLSFKKQASLAK